MSEVETDYRKSSLRIFSPGNFFKPSERSLQPSGPLKLELFDN